MGFEWKDIALIISIGLIPFIFFEIPVGEIVDKRLDEREIMAIGFLICALSLLLFSFVPAGIFILWAITMFLSRTGASILEPASESYFFRHSKGRDELIEIFRIGTPFAFIMGPLFGSLLLLFFDFKNLFPILSCVMLLGLLISLRLKDEKPYSV